MAVIFCDDGSDTTFISRDGARKLKAMKLAKTTLEITTLNGTETVSTCIYEVVIIIACGRKVPINAIELPKLTGVVSQLDGKVLSSIFPDFDVNILQRPSAPVDILLGGDYFSLHPKRELASDSKNLSIMQGELGVCVQGSHPQLSESTEKDNHVGYSVRVVRTHAFHATTMKVINPDFLPIVHKCVHEPVQQDDSQHFRDSHDFSVSPSEEYASSHAASQQDYNECSRQEDYTSQPTFDATDTQVVQDDITQVVHGDITQVVRDDITQVVQDNITQVVQDDFTQVVPDDITQVVHDDITQVVRDDITQGVQDDIASPVVCSTSPIRIESDKTTSIYNVSTRVLSKKIKHLLREENKVKENKIS